MQNAAKRWSVKEARQNFSEVLTSAAQGRPQRIIRRGKEVFVLASEAEWNSRAERAVPEPELQQDDLVKHLLSFPGNWEEDFAWVRESDRRTARIPDFADDEDVQ